VENSSSPPCSRTASPRSVVRRRTSRRRGSGTAVSRRSPRPATGAAPTVTPRRRGSALSTRLPFEDLGVEKRGRPRPVDGGEDVVDGELAHRVAGVDRRASEVADHDDVLEPEERLGHFWLPFEAV